MRVVYLAGGFRKLVILHFLYMPPDHLYRGGRLKGMVGYRGVYSIFFTFAEEIFDWTVWVVWRQTEMLSMCVSSTLPVDGWSCTEQPVRRDTMTVSVRDAILGKRQISKVVG